MKMTRVARALRMATLAGLGLALAGCVYAPPPAPGYGYAPGYYAAAPAPAYYPAPYYYPAPVVGSVSFGFRGHFR
jgi:hypothetical protein